MDGATAGLLAALAVKNVETRGHTARVARLAGALGRSAGLSEEELTSLYYGALLHDVGKLLTRIEVLTKPGKLDAQETAHMREHASAGEEIVRSLGFPSAVVRVVAEHHERFDGTGYPRRLKGYEIYRGARIFAVADTLDAMTNTRCYRKALPFAAARAEIVRCSGSQLDPAVVDAFLSVPARRRNMPSPELVARAEALSLAVEAERADRNRVKKLAHFEIESITRLHLLRVSAQKIVL